MTVTATKAPELETLLIDERDGIGTLTLNRPDALNAMSPKMIFELTLAAQWLADTAGFRALVVTGSGRAFSAGGDITVFDQGLEGAGGDLSAEVRRGADVLHQAIVDFHRIPFPVVAAINGAAAGAGLSLALMCDLRVAADSAIFACAYGRIGASPDGGMTYFLPRVVGPARALEILLEDPTMSAQDALERGLVTEVVSAAELEETARSRAERLAHRAPHYVKMAKRLIHQSLDNTIADHLQLERHGIADSMETADLRRGVKAFLAGEKPEFRGD